MIFPFLAEFRADELKVPRKFMLTEGVGNSGRVELDYKRVVAVAVARLSLNGVEMRSDCVGMFMGESIALPAVSTESSLGHFGSIESIEIILIYAKPLCKFRKHRDHTSPENALRRDHV